MKLYLFILVVITIMFSCRKETSPNSNSETISQNLLAKVKEYLKKNVSSIEFSSIDFKKTSINSEDSFYHIQLGFLSKDEKRDFILIKANYSGDALRSQIIHLEKNKGDGQSFNGNILVESLDHSTLISSQIIAGYIKELHPKMFSAVTANTVNPTQDISNILPVYYDELPEVVVVGYVPSSGSGLSWSDYMSFESLLGVGAGGSGSGNISGGLGSLTGIYTPIGGGSGGSGTRLSLPINYEYSATKPAIDLPSYMKCFANIPDAGAQFTITIYADLPVNNDPTKFFDWFTGATGHVFLQFSKSNIDQTVTQFIGFTAQKPLQAIGGVNPSSGKVVDNTGHKYNASLKVPVTTSEFSAAINKMLALASSKYDIVNFNCVDFALSILNAARPNFPLIINKYPLPDQPIPMSTPEGLYNLMNVMHRPGAPEAGNIFIGGVWNAGTSHGPCN